MSIVPLDPQWRELIDLAWIAELDATPFLTRCREGRASREELHAFVAQQFHYSRHFTRYLCALMANLSDEGDRAELASNLFEELGLGDHGGVAHSIIYRRMLVAMGVEPAKAPPTLATRALVDQMLRACHDGDALVGLGALCLGAEAIVPHVYSQLVEGFRAIGEPEKHLEFFHLHIEEDDEHAVTMGRIIARELAASPERRHVLRASARKLIAARAAFFRSIGVAHGRDAHGCDVEQGRGHDRIRI